MKTYKQTCLFDWLVFRTHRHVGGESGQSHSVLKHQIF